MIEINAVKHPGLHRYARELRQYPELTKKMCFMKFNSKMKGEKKWDFREKKL